MIAGAPPGLVAEIWERDEYRMAPWIAEGTPVLDIGAYVGVFSLWAASLGADVHAVEPHQPSYDTLLLNTHDNSKILTAWGAAGGTDGTCGIFERGFGGYTIPEGDIPMWSLESLLPRGHIGFGREEGHGDFVVKIDAEGAEYDILIGADLSRIRYLALEFHLWTVKGDPPMPGWGVRPEGRMRPDPVKQLVSWIERTHTVEMNGTATGGGYLYCERR